MRVLIALGGNALLERGQDPDAELQRHNVRTAARAIAPLSAQHELVITHGNGPQIGLLALQGDAQTAAAPYPLDMLGAETEGLIGYLITQELGPRLMQGRRCVAILTQVLVDATDPAFTAPSKPIGPVYDRQSAQALAASTGWIIRPDGDKYRRVVASPQPLEIVERDVIALLLREGIVVVCTGGGGVPVTRQADGSLRGAEAVVDKDLSSALLAQQLGCEMLLLLTDVPCVYTDWASPAQRAIRLISAANLAQMSFDSGSMAPKVEAACRFVDHGGRAAAIGRLADAGPILAGQAGTLVQQRAATTLWWDAGTSV